jgi:hypothetical protein
VDLDTTAVDEQSIRRISCSRQRAEYALPNAALGPTDEPVIERLLRTVDISAIRPSTATPQGMNDPTQHTTIIHTRLAAHVGRQQRLDSSPLRIGKPKEISHLTRPLNEAVNHDPLSAKSPLLGPDPSFRAWQ